MDPLLNSTIMVDQIFRRVTLSQMDTNMAKTMKSRHNKEIILNFVNCPEAWLLVFMVKGEEEGEVLVLESLPEEPFTEIFYFLKKHPVVLSYAAFNQELIYGNLKGRQLNFMLNFMNAVFIPTFHTDTSWPDSIKNEFSNSMQKFMSYLNDRKWRAENKTILYIPIEVQLTPVENACKNKEMIQRLEMIIIHWTRQIKELLSSQDTLLLTESSGPLEEIQFWSNRCDDLSGITRQLDKPGVKKVNTILQTVKSSYVAPFSTLSTLIKEGSLQARSNLKYLQSIKNLCLDLSSMTPSKIPKLLPTILNLVRLIWKHSPFYNSKERITGLLRKLSNEVINRCSASINLDHIFSGHVTSSKKILFECISCCDAWKAIYKKIQNVHVNYSELPWNLDSTAIFAQVDAFVQRCYDLVEVCDCQFHFSRNLDGKKAQMPLFKGHKGSETVRAFMEIESIYESHLEVLQFVKKTILDVKALSWLDDFSRFRSGMKDLEVMVQNLINTAFDTVTTVQEGVYILDVFVNAIDREGIKRTVEKKMDDLWSILNAQVNFVKREMAQKTPFLLPWQPKYAGMSAWVKMMKRGLEKEISFIDEATYRPIVSLEEEVRQAFIQVCHQVDEFAMRCYNEWLFELQKMDSYKLHDTTILKRIVDKGLIDINYDENLMKAFREVEYWEQMNSELPAHIYDVLVRRETYRVQRENVMLIVREYNRIVLMLSLSERGLFRERIMFLDRKVLPGLTKITWSQALVAEQFLLECKTNTTKIQQQIDSYKMANMEIMGQCGKISELLVLNINRKRVYEDNEFEKSQQDYCDRMVEKINSKHQQIIKVLMRTFEFFKNDGPEVQQAWFKYTVRVDRVIEEALKTNVRESLQELIKCIIEDGKAGQTPMFKLNLILKSVDGKETMDFSPSTDELSRMVLGCVDLCLQATKDIERLPNLLTEEPTVEPMREEIEKDVEVVKLKRMIVGGIQSGIRGLQQYLSNWSGFRDIWEMDKNAFMHNYRLENPPVASFDTDIYRYSELSASVQMQESIVIISFALVDASLLKVSVTGHCQDWQTRFSNLLYSLSCSKLEKVYQYIEESRNKLLTVPAALDQLEEILPVWDLLNSQREVIEGGFADLNECFSVLSKYEVDVADDVTARLKNLPKAWIDYCHDLEDSEFMLKKIKEKFRLSLMTQSEDLKRSITSLVADFHAKGPFSAAMKVEEAMSVINSFKEQVNSSRDQETAIRQGLMLFKLDQPTSKEIAKMEQELDQLEEVWKLAEQWDKGWKTWKDVSFKNVKSKELDDLSNSLFRKILKNSKELKTNNWPVVEHLRKKVELFRSLIPVINQLDNVHFRARHWLQIQAVVGKKFDYTSDSFTIEKIFEMEFHTYAEKINEISFSASKEVLIEETLSEMTDTWNKIEFDTVLFKDKDTYKIRSIEDILKGLESNQISLATSKHSPYAAAFADQIDQWERILSTISETVELLLIIQKCWLYLEHIFLGEDIRKQMPRETAYFDDVNQKWKMLMKQLHKIRNVYQACRFRELLQLLEKMKGRLEHISSCLDVYLETKRQIFPRFYFLSNNDMIEIMGLSRTPVELQYYIHKCFDHIKTLTMSKTGLSQKWEATHMNSADGESVAFINSVHLDGHAEVWMVEVEKIMKATVKEELRKAKTALRRNMSKKDQWIKEHPGQACICASLIQWTTDVGRALVLSKEQNEKNNLKVLKKKTVAMLNKLCETLRSSVNLLMRNRASSFLTIEIHSRDVLERLIKANCADPTSFDWVREFRSYWDRDSGEYMVKQTNCSFVYAYEYLGNTKRLVITPLTDRCYITILCALYIHKVGVFKGGAGTGKTETAKDIGKALGAYLVGFNCSEKLDYKSTGRFFSGLAQAGAMGCFDEFNHINIEVLSVVAQQMLSIFTALSLNATTFVFEGNEIKLNCNCGVLVTMNFSGHVGCFELPDNLKSMFRPIALLEPDTSQIVETMCFVQGFVNSKAISKKLVTLYSLAQQQLAKRVHYNFGIRTLISCIKFASNFRNNNNFAEDELFVLSILHTNIAMLKHADICTFKHLLLDIFPGVEPQDVEYPKFVEAMTQQIDLMGLQGDPHLKSKAQQIYELRQGGHCGILLGDTMTGKSTALELVKNTLSYLAAQGEIGYESVKDFALNPKAFSLTELYGEFNLQTNEWSDGIIPSIMRGICNDEKSEEKWLIFDGPLEPAWVESMNSLVDENKTLTLINGERIALSDQMALFFEVTDLSQSSAATVSRCGVVYFESSQNVHQYFVASWLQQSQKKQALAEEVKKMFEKYIEKLVSFKEINNCEEPVPVSPANAIVSLCRLFDAFAPQIDLADVEQLPRLVEMTFVFSLLWSLCGALNEEGRKKVDSCVRDMEGSFPAKDSVFDYYVDYKLRTWVHWEEKLKLVPKINPSEPFHQMMVPNLESLRYSFLLDALLGSNSPVLLVGAEGCGKTSLVKRMAKTYDPKNFSCLFMHMYSYATESNEAQEVIEARLEKKTKEVLQPIGGKRLLLVVDDLNMGKAPKNQPSLELFRGLLDRGFWYERSAFTLKHIKDLLWVGTMGPPGAGRNNISPRLQSKFNLLYFCTLPEFQLRKIFSTLLATRMGDFDDDLKLLNKTIAQASVELLKAVSLKLLPSPSRTHYMFNMHSLSKLYSGLMRIDKTTHSNKNAIIRLWIHESFRVFHDLLINEADRELFVTLLNDKLLSIFDLSFASICKDKLPPILCDFLNEGRHYEDFADVAAVREALQKMLASDVSEGLKDIPLDIMLYADSIEHVCRLARVLRRPKGHVMVVSVGGRGRRTFIRFAAFLCGYKHVYLDATDEEAFKEALNDLLLQVIMTKKVVVLSVSEDGGSDVIFRSRIFQGDCFDMLQPSTLNEIFAVKGKEVEANGAKEQAFVNFVNDSIKSNVRVVLSLSQFNPHFREKIRSYAPVVDMMTVNWYSELSVASMVEYAADALEKIEYISTIENTQKLNIAKMFAHMHKIVFSLSWKALEQRGTHVYVTRTHYLQVLKSFKQLLEEKRKEISMYKTKLKKGLWKIDDTKGKVTLLTEDMAQTKKLVEQYQRQCEEYLASIVQQKREADEHAKSVVQKSEKIAEEELKCRKMAEVAQADLAEALPGLEEAKKALESLNKKDITEIKSYGKPPLLVEKVLEAVMILRGNEPTWTEAKRQLSDSNFIKQLVNFDADNISDRCLKKVTAYCVQSDFQPEIVGRVSNAAKSLCMWVRAIEQYAKIYRVVEPKKQRLMMAEGHLNEKRNLLLEAQFKLAEIEDKMRELKELYELKLKTKEEFKTKAELMELKLERASQLLEGLSGEKDRWQVTVQHLEKEDATLVGNVVLSSAFISYMGLFSSHHRKEILSSWLSEMKALEIPHTASFNIANFLPDPTRVRDWNQQGLPGDLFSVENAIIATKSYKLPLMIDPHKQANKWIRNMEASNGLRVLDHHSTDFLKSFETCLVLSIPVLVENVPSHVDASLSAFVNQFLKRRTSRVKLKLLRKEIEVEVMRVFLTTKLSNHHYSAEVSLNFNIINFSVKEKGLENQLLAVMLRKERPELEEQKDAMVTNIGNGKRRIKELNDYILRLLNEVEGSLLDDEQLLVTLQSSKSISQEVNESLLVSEATEVKIDESREGYRSSAERASILFFALNDMVWVDPMYQFSLDSYVDLFNTSIEKSHKSARLEERILFLDDHHTYAVYRHACRGLFEKHKLTFAFNMCVRIMVAAGKVPMEEINFFLRGGIVMDRDSQMDNPCSWLPDPCWDNITELDKLTNFHGLITSFEQYLKDWKDWYISAEPETSTLPGEWEIACNELQRMLIVRSLRQDRVPFCVTSFITNNLGSKFVEPPILSLKTVLEESNAKTPLTFILSSGVDPTHDLMVLAESKGMLPERFQSLSLGQGQVQYAHKIILEGAREGYWIFLANCHLSISWLSSLDILIREIQADKIICHAEFRLWLSCNPNPHFPIAILHSGINMTTEPPKGLKANMKRMFSRVDDSQFSRNKRPERYKKVFFCLVFFHAIIIERHKFLSLGWNFVYDFNDADFEISANFVSMYMEEFEEIPWDALKFLVASINYGGHVVDEWDKRLLNVYISEFFVEDVINTNFYKLTSLPAYYIPKDGSLNSYREYISMLPNLDHPELFGQHTNADIICQIEESKALFETLLLVQRKRVAVVADKETKVLEIAEAVAKMVPDYIDAATAEKAFETDMSPLKNVLMQEVEKYNDLLRLVNKELQLLEKSIKGNVIMTEKLEQMFDYFLDSRVPTSWLMIYPSLKPLGSWVRNLVLRVEHFGVWASTASAPKIFWLSAFTDPTSFLTAVLQTSSHNLNLSIDLLTWDFTVMTVDDSNIAYTPKDGVLIRGLFLQGAGWDMKNSCLVEAEAMQLVNPLPTILFKPVELKRRNQRGIYQCPCYYYPDRAGTVERPSYVVCIDLKAGERSQEHWMKRGIAALMNLDL